MRGDRIDHDVEVRILRLVSDDETPAAVVYVLDDDISGSAARQMVAISRLFGELSPLLLVGIGYPVGDVYADPESWATIVSFRQHDLSPVEDAGYPPPWT